MPQDREYSELPEELTGALRKLFAPHAGWPVEQDGGVLDAVRRVRWERKQRNWRRAGMIGIAAAVALAAGTWWGNFAHVRAQYAHTSDIRDALHLAQVIQGGTPAGPEWDLNHGGSVDEKDVRLLAMAAVRLTPEKEATP